MNDKISHLPLSCYEISLVLNQMSWTEKCRTLNHSFTQQHIFIEPLPYARLNQFKDLGTVAGFGLLTIFCPFGNAQPLQEMSILWWLLGVWGLGGRHVPLLAEWKPQVLSVSLLPLGRVPCPAGVTGRHLRLPGL